jgi:hypothetical protein
MMKLFLNAAKAFAVVFFIALAFAVSAAPVFFGIVFLSATAVGAAIVYGLFGAVATGLIGYFKSAKSKQDV